MTVKKFIGTSLSLCMQDILAGRISIYEISAIVTSTRFESWQEAFDQYFHSYWSKSTDSETCKEMLQAVWHLVFQPRRFDLDSRGHYTGKGFWLNTYTGEYTKHLISEVDYWDGDESDKI